MSPDQESREARQGFLRDLDKKLWTAADRLRANLDAAVYSRAERDSLPQAARRVDAEASSNHAILGLIFLKYVSDSFAIRQREIEAQLRDPASDYHLKPSDYGSDALYEEAIRQELEERDYYIEKNVFWVPALARWKTLQDSAKLPPGTTIEIVSGRVGILPAKAGVSPATTYKITSTGRLIDDALEAIERENPKLKGVLNKTYTQLQLDPANLSSRIDLIATIPFEHADLHAKDILGHVYEYFLGQSSGARWTTRSVARRVPRRRHQFALAEGKKGGQPSGARWTAEGCLQGWRGGANQYFTPKSIVTLIVEMLELYQRRVYDPSIGSGGFIACKQAAKSAPRKGDRASTPSGVRGQDKLERGPRRFGLARRARRVKMPGRHLKQSNPTIWRLAAMNMAIRGIDFNFGNEPANSFTSDQHPDLRADYWRYGTPPKGNANFAWIQHMLHHLAPHDSMAVDFVHLRFAPVLLANGSLASIQVGQIFPRPFDLERSSINSNYL